MAIVTGAADEVGRATVDEIRSRRGDATFDRLGAALRAVAWADDGIVEGLELDDGWIVGVQWHPEDTAADDIDQQRLFSSFVEQAARPIRA